MSACPVCKCHVVYGCPSMRCKEALAAAGDEKARREVNRANAMNGYAPQTWEARITAESVDSR